MRWTDFKRMELAEIFGLYRFLQTMEWRLLGAGFEEELKQFTRISRDTCSICNYGLHMCKNITHLGLCMPLNIRPFNTFKDELLSNKFTRASVLCLFRPLAP